MNIGAAAALLAGAMLRGIFLRFHPRFGGDTFVYGELAQNMLAHHVFGFSEGVLRPTLIRLPGYPVFLAACFSVFGSANYVAVILVQAVVDLLGCLLLSRLASRVMGARAGMATLWLAALCPFTASYTAAALTETCTIFCVALAYFGLERYLAARERLETGSGWAVVTGVALSFAVLVRPDQGLLAAAVLPAMLWIGRPFEWRGIGRRSLPAALAALIVIAPLLLWGLRNWRVFHVVQPLSPRYANDPGETVPFGFQHWYRTWAVDYQSTYDIYWAYDGAPMSIQDVPDRAFDTPAQRAETVRLFDLYNQQTTATPELDQGFARLAAERTASHPVRTRILIPVAQELDMWLRPRTELMRMPIDWWRVSAHPRGSMEAAALALLNAAYLALAAIGFLRWRRMRWNSFPVLAWSMTGFVLLRCALLLSVDNSEPRYTLECFPVVILLAGFAFVQRGSGSSGRPTAND